MNYISTGDMAQIYQMRRHNVQIKEHMNRLTQEMTTGIKADLASAVSGDFMALAGIDRSLRTLESFRTASSEAALFSASMQAALASVQDIPAMIGPTLLSAATTTNPAQVNAAAADAREKFLGAVQTLNVQVGDRFIFSGTMTDTKPFADGADILAALGAAIAGETTATGVAAQVSAWFAAPVGGGGFLDTGYLGGDTALAAFRIGPDETAQLDAVGSDPALRGVLEGLALAALLAEGALSSDNIERSRLARTAGETILGAESPLIEMRAHVGTVEAHVEQASARNAAETSALEIARSDMISADPYDTASALEAVTTQMETLYTLTARLSRLNFADYM